jgi:phosphoserine phosphatase RsbU/P
MPSGSSLRRLLTLCALALACSGAVPAQSFDLGQNREPLVSLDGQWRFHPGDSPATSESSSPATHGSFAWAQPGFDDSAWPLLASDRSWSDQGYADMSGYGWYRFAVRIPAGDEPTALMLAPIVTSFQMFVDGRLVGQSGQMPPTPASATRCLPSRKPEALLRAPSRLPSACGTRLSGPVTWAAARSAAATWPAAAH